MIALENIPWRCACGSETEITCLTHPIDRSLHFICAECEPDCDICGSNEDPHPCTYTDGVLSWNDSMPAALSITSEINVCDGCLNKPDIEYLVGLFLGDRRALAIAIAAEARAAEGPLDSDLKIHMSKSTRAELDSIKAATGYPLNKLIHAMLKEGIRKARGLKKNLEPIEK